MKKLPAPFSLAALPAVALLAVALLAACGNTQRPSGTPARSDVEGTWMRGAKTTVIIGRRAVLFVASNGATNTGRLSVSGESLVIVEDRPSPAFLSAYFPPAVATNLSASAAEFSADYEIAGVAPDALTVNVTVRSIEYDANGTIFENRITNRIETWPRKH